MIAPHFNSICKQAELYYYDFIFNENNNSIPDFIIEHIEQCEHCHKQTNQLNNILSQPENYNAGYKSNHTVTGKTAMLKLHFAYINEAVTCDIVKPFLPNISDIKIPTPITVHLNHCQQCYEDLETIRELNLSRKQSSLLSQLFANKTATNNVSCTEAQGAIPSVVSMVFGKIDVKILTHLCSCPDCNKLLYRHREMTLRGLSRVSLIPQEFPCEKVSARDFFDYVIPYGIDPINDQYVKFRETLISHLRTCPDCLAKMQELQMAIYKIHTRVESEVITTYQIDKSAKIHAVNETDNLYAGFPIKVEVKQREKIKIEEPVSSTAFSSTSPPKISIRKFTPLIKTGAVAAAVIFITTALLQNIPTAGASALQKIYDAIVKVQNVHIASYIPGQEVPIQEKWVSRTLNIYMTKTGDKYVFWDMTNGIKKVKSLDISTTEIQKLTSDNITGVEQEMGSSFGLMPFYSISSIPENSHWSRVPHEDLETYNEGTQVYELTWDREKYDGTVLFWKWRVFVNTETSLPQKSELYVKLTADTEYTLDSVMTVEYLGETDIQTILKDISF